MTALPPSYSPSSSTAPRQRWRTLRGWTLRRTYLGVLAVLGILAVLSNALLDSGLRSVRGDTQWTNVAGRQRMLSQRIAWDATRLLGTRGIERDAVRTRLRETLLQFQRGYRLLSNPSSALYSGGAGSERARQYAAQLGPEVRGYGQAVQRLLESPQVGVNDPNLRTVQEQASVSLLEALDRAVLDDTRRSQSAVEVVERLSWARTLLVLALLFGLGLFVFRPLEQRNRTTLMTLEGTVAALAHAGAYSDALLDIFRRIESGDSPEDVARFSVQALARVADVDWGGLVVIKGDHAQVVNLWASSAVPTSFLEQVSRGSARGEGLVWQALNARQGIFVDDYPAQRSARSELVGLGMQAGAWVPLGYFEGGAYLLSAVRLHVTSGWSAADRALFEAAAHTVGVSLERRNHQQTLEKDALTDALTSLGNRRAFERDLDALCASARRHQYAACVLSMDIDGLKQVNDLEGHARGDALLSGFARALESSFRREDRLYRLGGDEFTALLSYCGPDAEAVVRGRVNNAVAALQASGFERVGASAGMAFYPQDAQNSLELTEQADARMYAEKRARKEWISPEN